MNGALMEERDTADGWHVIKYANGKAECWKHHHLEVDFSTTSVYGGYVSNPIAVDLPIRFVERPITQISGNTEQQILVGWIIAGNQTVSCKIYNTAPGTVKTDLDYYVVGRWK